MMMTVIAIYRFPTIQISPDLRRRVGNDRLVFVHGATFTMANGSRSLTRMETEIRALRRDGAARAE